MSKHYDYTGKLIGTATLHCDSCGKKTIHELVHVGEGRIIAACEIDGDEHSPAG